MPNNSVTKRAFCLVVALGSVFSCILSYKTAYIAKHSLEMLIGSSQLPFLTNVAHGKIVYIFIACTMTIVCCLESLRKEGNLSNLLMVATIVETMLLALLFYWSVAVLAIIQY